MGRQAALGLACVLLVLTQSTIAQAITVGTSKSCTWVDDGYIQTTATTGQYKIRFPDHTGASLDNVNWYLGSFDIAKLEAATSSCPGFGVTFASNPNMYPSTEVTWYRVPVNPPVSGQAVETDFDMNLSANQAFIYIPIRTVAPSVASSATARTYSPNLKVGSWNELFQRSAVNLQNNQVGNPYGMLVSNANNAYHVILVQPYQLDATLIPSPLSTSSINNCPTADVIYHNCGIQYGKLTGPAPANSNGPTGNFVSYFKINFVLWWMTITTLCYFFWGVGGDNKSVIRPEDEDNRFFNHPFYSCWTFGTELQTKMSRVTLVYITLATMLFGCGFMHYYLREKDYGTRVGAAIPVALAWSWVVVHYLSYFLNGLTNTHYQFIEDMKKSETHEKRLDADNTYENRRSKWNFAFYVQAFLIAMGSYWGCIGITINFTNTRFWWMMLSYGIVIVGEFFILDYIISVGAGKGEGGFAKWVKSRGYFINYDLHRKWDDFQATLE